MKAQSKSTRRDNWFFGLSVGALVLCLIFFGIQLAQREGEGVEWDGSPSPGMASSSSGRGPVFEKGDRRFLWGGPQDNDHFDVTEFLLDPSRLHYGLGREAFPALIEPEFISVESANRWLQGDEKILGVKIGNDVRAYPVRLLVRHEVVNDVVGGQPIFAAYCILADLGAIYDRRIAGQVCTFAVSGYTYSDPQVWEGRDAFVLWDRDTESLWWPPIGKAVSGPLLETSMKLLPREQWTQTTWRDFRQQFPEAKVLKLNQKMARPNTWRKAMGPFLEEKTRRPEEMIAPHWGKNRQTLGESR